MSCDHNEVKMHNLVQALEHAGCPEVVYKALAQVPTNHLRDMKAMIEDILLRNTITEMLGHEHE